MGDLVPKGRTTAFLPAAFVTGLIIGVAGIAPAHAELPESLNRVLSAAIADGDQAEITSVARSMIDAYPDQEGTIRQRLADASSDAAQAALAALSAPEANAGAATATVQESARETPEAETPDPPLGFFGFSGWTGEFEVGGTLNTGNTEEKSVSTAIALDREAGPWTHSVLANFDFTRTDGTTSKRRFIGNYELDYDFGPRSYAYGFAEYRDDRFSGYDYRVISSAGYGYNMIDRPTLGWELEGGPGVRYNKFQGMAQSETEFVGRFTSSVEWQISDTATFTNTLGVLTGTNTTSFDTLTALTMQINSRLSAQMSFETRTDTKPPAGAEKTDTTTKGSLVYNF